MLKQDKTKLPIHHKLFVSSSLVWRSLVFSEVSSDPHIVIDSCFGSCSIPSRSPDRGQHVCKHLVVGQHTFVCLLVMFDSFSSPPLGRWNQLIWGFVCGVVQSHTLLICHQSSWLLSSATSWLRPCVWYHSHHQYSGCHFFVSCSCGHQFLLGLSKLGLLRG